MQRRMGARRWSRPLIAGLMVGASAVAAGGAPASAGVAVANGDVDVTIRVFGGPADDVLAGLTFELYQGGSKIADPGCDPFAAGTESDPVFAVSSSTCTPGDGEFQVGLDGVPPQYSTFATCTTPSVNEAITDGTPTFTLGSNLPGVVCTIDVRAATLAIDKVVVGGDATVADFEFEVYDGDGALIELDPIVDPDAALCEETLGDCVLVGLPFGEYTLGEVVPAYGYAVTDVECTVE
ncbi:MAG: SpaA isopeptide-forming pilin-related protein, partial [Acidimicrobiia bacterium]